MSMQRETVQHCTAQREGDQAAVHDDAQGQVQQETLWIVNREFLKEGDTSCPNEPPTRLALGRIEDEAAIHDEAHALP